MSKSNWLGLAFGLDFVVIGLGIWGEFLFDFKVGPLNLAIALLKWFSSLPLEGGLRKTLSGILAIPLGVLLGGVLAMFGAMLPPLFVISYLENTRFSTYSYKLAWILLTIGQYLLVYHLGFHWPFEHRATPYYSALYEISRLAGWLYLPVAGFWLWTTEYYRYTRVKRQINILPIPL